MQLAWKLRLGAAVIVVPAALSVLMPGYGRGSSAPVAVPEIVELRPGSFPYRASGEFTQAGLPAPAPMVTGRVTQTLAIMTHQVTAADYRRCIDAGACPKTADQGIAASDRPVVKVSWVDAQAYAAWLSRETGMHFRLPTDEEWAFAAASRFTDDGVTQSDPGQRALASYDLEVKRSEAIDREPKPIGSFGANEKGLVDLAGNVWEWTDTCFVRSALDGNVEVAAATSYCGIRIAEGRHRAYMIDFIRDARGGGCSVGIPPTNLGFRLVRDDDPSRGLRALLARAQRLAGLGA